MCQDDVTPVVDFIAVSLYARQGAIAASDQPRVLHRISPEWLEPIL
jgi:hypothetical protein